MSILKYFKWAPKTASDELLPDPDGTLSKIVLPSAIKMANDEVAKVVNDEERKSDTSTDELRGTQSRPNGYLILTPAQRFGWQKSSRAWSNSITSLFYEKVSTSSSKGG